MKKYSSIVDFIIYCKQDAKDLRFYPKHYGEEIFDIISPNLKTEVIECGKTYDFKIKSPHYKFFILQKDIEEKNKSFFRLLKNEDYNPISLKLRVGNVYKNTKLEVLVDGEVLISKPKRVLTPGEMQSIDLKEDELKALKKASEILVRVA